MKSTRAAVNNYIWPSLCAKVSKNHMRLQRCRERPMRIDCASSEDKIQAHSKPINCLKIPYTSLKWVCDASFARCL